MAISGGVEEIMGEKHVCLNCGRVYYGFSCVSCGYAHSLLSMGVEITIDLSESSMNALDGIISLFHDQSWELQYNPYTDHPENRE